MLGQAGDPYTLSLSLCCATYLTPPEDDITPPPPARQVDS